MPLLSSIKIPNRHIFLFSVLVGFIYFLSFNCLYILNPGNVTWLLRPPDIAQHFLGWLYFRETPFLQYPLGLNPDYGMLPNNSIIYTDSIPILAFVFKYLRWILPHPFQYSGWWMLACIVLQYYFAAKLLSTKIENNLIVLLASFIFLFNDNFVLYFRIAGGQFSLAAHFLILAALYFAMRQKFLFRHWLLLISVSLLVQIYIACAVTAIFIFDLTGRIYKKELNYRSAFSSLAVTFLLSLLIMYISGYFTYTVKEILNTDFWGTNIFSLRIGLAPTVLLVLMIGFIIKDKKIFKEPIKSIPIFLVTGCILLYIFSWGPNWQLAGHTVLTLPHIPLYTIFRNMHRFALPLTYLVMFFIFLTFSKKVGDKNKIIIPLLIGLIVLQFYDHRNNYFKTKQVLKATDQYLTDFGTYSAEILKKDSLICTGEMTKSAVDAVYLFALSGKPSRCAFISRINAFEPINIEYFANNRYNKNSVYLINSNPANQSVWSYLEANFSEAEVVEVNGLHFFLPEK